MKTLKWLLSVCLATMLGTVNAETLQILGDDAYAPVIYAKDGVPWGALPAILARAQSLTGDTYQLKLAPWKRSYELAARGEAGVIGLSHTTERAKIFDFSKPLYNDDIQIVTLKGKDFSYARLDDLKDKVIGGVNGASYGEIVDKAIADGLFKVDRDVSQSGRLRKLLAGRLDAAFIGNGQAGFETIVEATPELASERGRFVVLPTPLTRDPLHLAFPKSMNKRDVLDRFDAALEKLRNSGQLKKIIAESIK